MIMIMFFFLRSVIIIVYFIWQTFPFFTSLYQKNGLIDPTYRYDGNDNIGIDHHNLGFWDHFAILRNFDHELSSFQFKSLEFIFVVFSDHLIISPHCEIIIIIIHQNSNLTHWKLYFSIQFCFEKNEIK